MTFLKHLPNLCRRVFVTCKTDKTIFSRRQYKTNNYAAMSNQIIRISQKFTKI